MVERFYVYRYFDPARCEVIYIGKGQGKRAYDHLQPKNLRRTTPFYNRLRKMRRLGIDPIVTILNAQLTEVEAFQLENFYVLMHGRRADGTGTLLNLTEGGEGLSGRKHSDEHKRRIGHASAASWSDPTIRHKRLEGMKGHRVSEDGKRRIALLNARNAYNVTHPDGTSERVTNLSEFSRAHDLYDGGLAAVATGRRSHVHGYRCQKLEIR